MDYNVRINEAAADQARITEAQLSHVSQEQVAEWMETGLPSPDQDGANWEWADAVLRYCDNTGQIEAQVEDSDYDPVTRQHLYFGFTGEVVAWVNPNGTMAL